MISNPAHIIEAHIDLYDISQGISDFCFKNMWSQLNILLLKKTKTKTTNKKNPFFCCCSINTWQQGGEFSWHKNTEHPVPQSIFIEIFRFKMDLFQWIIWITASICYYTYAFLFLFFYYAWKQYQNLISAMSEIHHSMANATCYSWFTLRSWMQ